MPAPHTGQEEGKTCREIKAETLLAGHNIYENGRENKKKRRRYGKGSWRVAVGGAVGIDGPTGLAGEVAEDLVNVSTGGEGVAAVLAEAVEDVGGDGPPLPLSHLRLLLLTHASHLLSPSSSSCSRCHGCSSRNFLHGRQKWWKETVKSCGGCEGDGGMTRLTKRREGGGGGG